MEAKKSGRETTTAKFSFEGFSKFGSRTSGSIQQFAIFCQSRGTEVVK